MDSWGVVIVAVVGVIGTVAGTWIQGHHTRRAAEEARRFEQRESLRPLQLEAFATLMETFADMDQYAHSPSDDKDPFAELRAKARAAELPMARFAALVPSNVVANARALLDCYCSISSHPLSEFEDIPLHARRDALVASFRQQRIE
ncbi:hypothetical protein ET989_06645 [Propioniciclava sinopodophylli]|uniref:Uncharacterized protein n=1 Tax=Propioniciclava sinopodophylli TaxID=1837344 RepID=A0A4Q9KE79_9ACTN|nr:hypothetical protein [Propioniciclava sinopodophylli]TBT85420.1 hypothetical protein ET989_06645 [Propioniciclava sinopodophylli]